jgi:hypothetical protein
MMLSANAYLELRGWLRWASEGGNTPMFMRKVSEAALIACSPDYELLRPVLLELKRHHPQPPPGWAAQDDLELRDWLCWVSEGGYAPSFVRRLAEAALGACGGDSAILRQVLLQLEEWYPQRMDVTET